MINDNNDGPYSHNFKFNNFEFNIIINKYIVKIIDYGYIKNYPTLHTIKYMKLYFNNLFDLNIISEVLLFTFFFFMSIYPQIDKNIINNLNEIIRIIFNNNDIEYIIKNFDALFLNILFNSL